MMNLPTYKDIMVPALELLAAADVIRKRDFTAPLAERLGLQAEARLAEYTSGNGNIFEDRASWALSYLSLSGLVEKPKRGFYRISPVGRDLLQHPERVELYVAEKVATRERERRAEQAAAEPAGTSRRAAGVDAPGTAAQTPLEELVIASGEIRDAVAQEILDTILSKTPDAFERLVLELLSRLGYGGEIHDAAEQTARSRDGGIDGVIRQDYLGLGRIHVQAKRYAADHAISRPDVQGFIGAVLSARGNKGVFITTSRFTADAIDCARNLSTASIVLIDGARLSRLVYDHGLGMQVEQRIELKKLDSEYWDAFPDDLSSGTPG